MRTPLALWSGFVLLFATLSYTLRFTEGKPPKDLLYKWSTVEGNLIQFAIIAAIVYGIAGLGDRRRLLALRRPTSWRTALRIGIGIGMGMVALTYLLSPVLHPGREQGVTPDTWQPDHAVAYVANGLVIAVVAPIVEEATFRGLGYSLLARWGRWTAIVLVGVSFGLAHGLVQDRARPLQRARADCCRFRQTTAGKYARRMRRGLVCAVAVLILAPVALGPRLPAASRPTAR